MDLFKQINNKKATSYDFNTKVVKLGDRPKVHKLLNRYSRRKLKQELKAMG